MKMLLGLVTAEAMAAGCGKGKQEGNVSLRSVFLWFDWIQNSLIAGSFSSLSDQFNIPTWFEHR